MKKPKPKNYQKLMNVLLYINGYKETHGHFPSRVEIGKAFGVSRQHATSFLNGLVKEKKVKIIGVSTA
jgi:hypothetical protein